MTEMTYDDFAAPSTLGGGGGYRRPTLSQMAGRLIHLFPTDREDGVVTPLKTKPHTRIVCELTFLDGAPIDGVTDKNGARVADMTPPVGPGQVMAGYWINQDWLVNRLKDRVGKPGFPGMVGVLGLQHGKAGNPFWALTDPSAEQMASIRQWWQWRREQGDGALYVPDPEPMHGVSPFAQPAGQPAAAPADPWSAPPARPIYTPADPWSATPAQSAPPSATPAAATDLPPWQR